MKVWVNSYYSWIKGKEKRAEREKLKHKIMQKIKEIYHNNDGTPGYRTMQVYLGRRGINLSVNTVHKYMNCELKLHSICRRKKVNYSKAPSGCSTVFENKLNRDFKADGINQKWCIDFTYLPLVGGKMMYNCAIIDLYDRSIVSSITDKNITADLAVRTLKKALDAQEKIEWDMMIHSDRGSQLTSKQFRATH